MADLALVAKAEEEFERDLDEYMIAWEEELRARLGASGEPEHHARASEAPALDRAKAADLVTFGRGIDGTRCANCMYVARRDNADHCDHPKVMQELTDGAEHMCCKFWDRPGTQRAWQEGTTTR